MTENEQFIFESIENQIKSGFYPLAEIIENVIEEVEDNEFEDEISEEWVTEKINKTWNNLVTESKTWQQPTHVQLLTRAFEELQQNNIITLHNAGYTISDGEYECVEVERELRKEGVVSEGYCFYHQQDVEGIIQSNRGLYLAFQKIDNSDDSVTMQVGEKIVEILKQNNLEVEWNKTPTERIFLPNFQWQKVYNEHEEDLLNYDIVIERMLGDNGTIQNFV